MGRYVTLQGEERLSTVGFQLQNAAEYAAFFSGFNNMKVTVFGDTVIRTVLFIFI
jgi:hypothetical protein